MIFCMRGSRKFTALLLASRVRESRLHLELQRLAAVDELLLDDHENDVVEVAGLLETHHEVRDEEVRERVTLNGRDARAAVVFGDGTPARAFGGPCEAALVGALESVQQDILRGWEDINR